MKQRAFVCLTVGACLLLCLSLGAGCKAKAAACDSTPAVEPVPVTVLVVAPSMIVDRAMLPCTVKAFDEVKISAEVAGRITMLTHEEGQQVKAAEVLFRCDTEKLQADVDRAKAAYELAQAGYRRIDELARSKYGQATADQVDHAVAERDVAKANLDTAKISLDRATIRSPLDGFLECRYVDVGEFVNPGMPVADVVRIDKLKVYVEVPEREVSYVEPGAQVLLHFKDGEPDYPGVVDNIARVGDAVTRTYHTRIVMDNKDMRIRPGMIGNTILLRGKPHQGIRIPLDAVIARKGIHRVVLVVDGKAVDRDVQLGVFDAESIEVLKGLSPGDRIIVDGQRQVNDGDPVRVEDDKSAEQGSASIPQATVTDGSHDNK